MRSWLLGSRRRNRHHRLDRQFVRQPVKHILGDERHQLADANTNVRSRRKRDFIQGVDESISGAMIAGNKLEYVGDDVDLHCTVFSIIDGSTFNAQCGEDSDGLPAIIAVRYDDASSLNRAGSSDSEPLRSPWRA